ncbi:MAG: alpha/beta fold hydrolase [Anaerolineaceae bacterium]|nr:alpha/beta fold hydrolase [Anaerolineaceae bacterium]
MAKGVMILTLLWCLLGGIVDYTRAQNTGESQVIDTDFESATLGRVYQYKIYLPAGYDALEKAYPVVYLLHGRGDTMSAWLNVRSTLDSMIAVGDLPPLIVVMPDMPSNDRASYYIDSAYTGHLYRAEAVETAFFTDLIPQIDSTYRTLADRRSRIVGGYSMGGYGAIRYALAHSEMFMGALILSPAVYYPLPPDDSSTREFGAFGSGTALFDEDIYTRLNYPALLESFSGEYRLNLFIAVGDDEWKNPNPADMEHDLDFEAHRFFNRVARVSGIASEFRVYNGGHDWDVWQPGFVEGMRYLANSLSTEPPEGSSTGPDGWLTGTPGEDMAGGIGSGDDGSIYQALGVSGSLNGQPYAGGIDIAVVKYGANRVVEWTRQLGTSGNDRPYGLVVTAQQEVVVVGYTYFNRDGVDYGDDIFAFKLDANGERLWQVTIGSAEADRGYAIALTPEEGVVIAGYSKSSLGARNEGDKDIVAALISPEGDVVWIYQTGGAGEDKAQAVSVGADGRIYVAGMTSSALTPDAAGGIDGFILALTPDGEEIHRVQFGTGDWDEVTGIVTHGEQIVVTGFTAGDLAAPLSGDKDLFMMAFDASLTRIAADQIGSNLNDKGAAIAVLADGSILVAGYSNGRIVANQGDFDVILARYDADYTRQAVWQWGTEARDGTDEWAEKNLFIAPFGDSAILSGLTLGNLGESTNSGGSDVFIILPDLTPPDD